ncbi:probable RNA-binding protein 19 [Culicoides brevitarsis]|uniref:probable RNA-binding protein 19 n=1 Tax=Culicoides brevitarsis TaxID=469753 RepID=UPI00307C178B
MSRIIVKNLPKRIDEQKLREHFNQKGNVTDIQLKYTKEGKFRQFGFVGFETDEQAQEAIKFYDKTFIATSRIAVELCKELTQPVDEKSKNDENDEKNQKNKGNAFVKDLIDQHKNDPLFKEFIETHGKKALWQDGVETEAEPTSEHKKIESPEEKEDQKLANKEISDKDYMKSLMKKGDSKGKKPMVELFTVKLRNLPKNTKRQDVQKFFKPLKPASVRIPGLKLRFAYAGFKTKTELNKALAKHKSFFNGKQIEVYDFTAKSQLPEETGAKNNAKAAKWEGQKLSLEGEESVCESGKLFFRNLAYTVGENDLQKVFEPFGPIADINVPIDATTRKIKGFGTVTFVMPEHAVKAYSKLNGSMFHGRMFHLLPGKMDEKDKEGDEDDTNFKKKKEEKLKKTAGSSHNWNTLFLGPNAVADVLARDYQMTKEGILDTHAGGSSAAVRLALGETEIVQKMKNFLEENGVSLKAFEGVPKERSKTVLLAKNLPASTSEGDLKPMFAKFGPLGRFVFPPSGVTCLIEYLDPSEAKKAFKGLAYKMFKGQPLYLEWAPEQTFTGEKPSKPASDESKTEKSEEKEEKQEIVKEEVKQISTNDDPPEEGTTLFIKNLNFKTVEATVYRHFEKIGDIHTVQVVMKPDPKNVKAKVSAGYGFIQFKKRASLEKALKNLQFSEIEGNKIELKRSDRTLKGAETARKSTSTSNSKQTGTKLLIRNIPFQAKESELQDIFKVFGELKALRLPKKMNADTHRGFGFAEYYTKEEAKRAFDALSSSTHLYGRRLVLEWAMEEGVEDIRKRTADHFAGDDRKPKRKGNAVFNMDEQDVAGAAGDDDD